MQINLQHIGVVHKASINLSGITVLTGANGTGKTTVSKALYSLILNLGTYEMCFQREREEYNQRLLAKFIKNSIFYNSRQDFISNYPYLSAFNDDSGWQASYLDFLQGLRSELQGLSARANDSLHPELKRGIIQELKALDYLLKEIAQSGNSRPINYLRVAISNSLSAEFNGQIQSLGCDNGDSLIQIESDLLNKFNITIRQEKVCPFRLSPVPFQNINILYFDSINILDQVLQKKFVTNRVNDLLGIGCNECNLRNPHASHIRDIIGLQSSQFSPYEQVRFEDNDMYGLLVKRINDVLPGQIVNEQSSSKLIVYLVDDGKKINVLNLSSGLKLFVLLKLLLKFGAFNERLVLIFDGVEASLSLENQKALAEILAILSRGFKVKILLNAYSDSFMGLLDEFVDKYQLRNITNYYKAYLNESGYSVFKKYTV